MASEKKFIRKALSEFRVKEFLEEELEKAGVSSIEIQKTPVATRITINVRRPGIVVGKQGRAIKDLCDALEKRYGIENPQLEVVEVRRPELDPKLAAEKIARQIEIRGNAKQAIAFTLREIMGAGAIGAEIIVAGKVIGKGAKAKVIRARAGYLKKSGEIMKLVREGKFTAYPRAGAIGVTVKIVPPGTIFPDKVDVSQIILKAPEAAAEVAAEPAAAGETAAEPKAQ
jgi:small subunit ribosomal protein S3